MVQNRMFKGWRDGRSAIYEGETSRNAFTRGMEHLDALRLQDEENALWKHCLVVQDGIEAQFSMQVVGVYRTPLVRQVDESVRIIISKAECVMNSKSEWHQDPLVRIIPMSGLQEEQGAGRGSLQQPGGAGREGGAGRGGGTGRRGGVGRGGAGQSTRGRRRPGTS